MPGKETGNSEIEYILETLICRQTKNIYFASTLNSVKTHVFAMKHCIKKTLLKWLS